MEQFIAIVIGLAIISLPWIHYLRRRRRDERSIRIWADEHHYALLSLRGPGGLQMIFPGLGLMAGMRLGLWVFELDVQDEQGGQFTLTAQTRFRGKIDIQRS
jgi:hypothetical protein